jgi:peptidoglycan-associated lipoprotein
MLTRLTVLLGALAVAGCARSYPSTEMVAVRASAQPLACAADADCGTKQLCVDRACHDVAGATVAACTELPIHFTTSSAVIDSRNRRELNETATCLRSDRSVHVTIAGNADERGDSTYNRDLAQRRADAVAGYLEAAGVSPSQLSTVTYGADNPLCDAHDSDCWKQNRRVEIAPRGLRANAGGEPVKNKNTSDNDTKGIQRIDSTGNGTDNGSPLGK